MYAWHSPHDLINIHLAVVYILAHGGLVEQFLDILHGVGTVVRGKWAGLANWIDVSHVPDGGSDCLVLVFDKIVYLFVGGISPGDEVVLVKVRVVWSGYVRLFYYRNH